MTGYGNGTAAEGDIAVTAEIRSVNSRYFELSMRLPRLYQYRELEIRDMVKSKINRGKLSLSVSIQQQQEAASPIAVDKSAVAAYHRLLEEVRGICGIGEEISLNHLLKFPDIFRTEEAQLEDEMEWRLIQSSIMEAVMQLASMKSQEGGQLSDDLRGRIGTIGSGIDEIERLSAGRVDIERQRLTEKVRDILGDERLDPARLEQEIVLFASKTDITEELVRMRSHNRFFLEALDAAGSEGRKLTFLVQEMNRESNTIASKSYESDIAHIVVDIKEELERIREQLQNVE
jgi:uncharacterized protein (TIGR00255 family)